MLLLICQRQLVLRVRKTSEHGNILYALLLRGLCSSLGYWRSCPTRASNDTRHRSRITAANGYYRRTPSKATRPSSKTVTENFHGTKCSFATISLFSPPPHHLRFIKGGNVNGKNQFKDHMTAQIFQGGVHYRPCFGEDRTGIPLILNSASTPTCDDTMW